MTIIRNGTADDYYSQRNNALEPFGSCNVTAMVDALSCAGWALPSAPGQPEDRLYSFIERDQECRQLWKSLDPAGVIPPQQWMAVLALGANRWMREPVVEWRESADPVRMIATLASGGTCVVSGMFPSTSGHVVALVGVAYDETVPYRINYWIVDDPYGNYHGRYVDQHGFGISLPPEDFLSILKPQGLPRKWCHFVRPREERNT